MTTLHLVRPELRNFLETFPIPEMNAEHLTLVRQAPSIPYPPPPEVPDLAIEERRIPGPEGAPDVRVLIYRPTSVRGGMPAILHMHGGGFVLGAPEMSDTANLEDC